MPDSPTRGLSFAWLGHATSRIELDGVVMLTDPVLGRWVGPLRRSGPLPAPESYAGIQVVLISHAHHDHLDVRSLRRLPRETTVLAAPGTARFVRLAGLQNVAELAVGQTMTIGRLAVTAVAARHDGRRLWSGGDATAVGYLIQGSQSVYFAGDTGPFAGLAELRGSVDLALLPIGGWGLTLGPEHMDACQAANVTALIAPRFVVPVHFGTLAIPGTRAALTPLWRRQDAGLFAKAVAHWAPATRPVIAPPGEMQAVPSWRRGR